jgi:hypothetical protein
MPQSDWNGTFYPAEKWFPASWPPYEWQVIQSPPTLPIEPPSPPTEGGPWPWWLYPKDQWPYQPVPWEPKVFGAFTARKVKMREDIGAPVNDGPPKPWPPYNIWPTVKYPQPAGLAHVNTRRDGTYGFTKSVSTIKVHMRPDVWLEYTPHKSEWAAAKLSAALTELSRKRPLKLITEDGSSITIRSIRHPNWHKHRAEYQAREAKRKENLKAKLAEKIAAYDGKPQPTGKDLFS